jgi:hypothetical protein
MMANQQPQPTYEQYAAQMLALEEQFFGRAARATQKIDPTTGQTAKAEPAHQPFDLQTANAENQVVQGAQGYRIAIYEILLYNSGDQEDVTIKDGVGGQTLAGPLTALPSTTGLFLPWSDVPYFTLSPGNSFVITTAAVAAPRLTGFVKYRLIQ